MFPSKTDIPAENLDAVINAHLAAMQTMDPLKSAEYADAVKQLDTLYSLRPNKAAPLSADAKLTAAVNLAGIIMILKHEQVGVITSKALSFIAKLR